MEPFTGSCHILQFVRGRQTAAHARARRAIERCRTEKKRSAVHVTSYSSCVVGAVHGTGSLLQSREQKKTVLETGLFFTVVGRTALIFIVHNPSLRRGSTCPRQLHRIHVHPRQPSVSMIPFSDFQSKQNPADSLFICPLGADCQRGFASIVVCPQLLFIQHWPFRHAPRDGMAELRRSTFPSRNDALPPHQTACPPLPIHLASTGAKICKRGGGQSLPKW